VVEDGRMTTCEIVVVPVTEKKLEEAGAVARVELVGPVPRVTVGTEEKPLQALSKSKGMVEFISTKIGKCVMTHWTRVSLRRK